MLTESSDVLLALHTVHCDAFYDEKNNNELDIQVYTSIAIFSAFSRFVSHVPNC